jgi:predicted ribosomally synthesized peptide with SipW-like signal peptide
MGDTGRRFDSAEGTSPERGMNDMPDEFELSRRKALAALGTVGVASAGAGLGTSAFFSDQETFENNQLTAGTLDMKVGWEEHYSDWSEDEAEHAHMEDGKLVVDDRQGFMNATLQERFPDKRPPAPLCEALADVPDDLERPVIELDDVKPGDFGEVTFTFALCDNPGYVWLNGRILTNEEDGVTEPEADDPGENDDPGDATTTGELAEAIEVTIWYDDNCNNVRDELDVDPGGQFVLGDDDGDDGGNGEDDSPTTAEGDITGDGEDETVRATKEEPNGENPVVEHENGKISTVTVKMGDREIESVEIVDGVAVIRTPQYPENKGPMEADVDGDGDPDVRVTGTEDSGEQEKSIFEGSLFELFHEPYGPAPLPETQVASIPLDGRPITTAFASLDGIDTDGDGLPDENLSAGDGSDPDRECFAPERRHCLGFKWELPADHGNEVQSDSVAFDLGFYTEQCRHNDGSGMNDEQVGDDEPAR